MGDQKNVILDPRPVQIDSAWGFNFAHPDGREDNVCGFLTWKDSISWLRGTGAAEWARNRGYTVTEATDGPWVSRMWPAGDVKFQVTSGLTTILAASLDEAKQARTALMALGLYAPEIRDAIGRETDEDLSRG